ncbi:Probable xyloglucan galactosyltransferase gt19 [Dionaea muscipula]
MLELIFHRRILEYPCLTSDPDAADAVFLPYYAGIDALRYLYGPEANSSSDHGLDLFNFLQENEPGIWARNSGHDHFLVMARTAWDFSQPRDADPLVWGTSFLQLPEFYNVTALTLESRAWPWQEQAIPHPTSFHPRSLALLESWILRVRRSHRSTLMLFVGGGGTSTTPNIRRSIREECQNGTGIPDGSGNGRFEKLCEIVDCSNGVCEHDPIRYMKPMLQASFCLQPPGDTPARRSTFDGIIAGCIPVFFEEQSARAQYRWHLPAEEFGELSVTIPKEDVVFKAVSIVDVLMGISRGEVRRMREKVMELIPTVMYRKHGSSLGLRTKKDAFDVAIDGTLTRIQSRLRELQIACKLTQKLDSNTIKGNDKMPWGVLDH